MWVTWGAVSILTYRDVQQRVNRVVHAIHNLNLEPNARIAVVDYNTHRYMELYFGASLSGRILSPLNIRLSEDEYVYTHPDVLECAVISMADDRWGEVPKAVVVLRKDATVTEQELIDHTRERLASFKAPKKVIFVKELPKTGSGKILKVKLRENHTHL